MAIQYDKERVSIRCERCIKGCAVVCGDVRVCVNCGAEYGSIPVKAVGRKSSGPEPKWGAEPTVRKEFRTVIEAIVDCLRDGRLMTAREVKDQLITSGFNGESVRKALLRHARFIRVDKTHPPRYRFESSIKYGRWGNVKDSSVVTDNE